MPSRLAVSGNVVANHVVAAVILSSLTEGLDEIATAEKGFASGLFCKQAQRAARILPFQFCFGIGVELRISKIGGTNTSRALCRTHAGSSQIDRVDGDLSVVQDSPQIVVGIVRTALAGLLGGRRNGEWKARTRP